MFEALSQSLERVTNAIHTVALTLIAAMMTLVGLMLALGGRVEAIIPLALGGFAFMQVRRPLEQLKRKLSGSGNPRFPG
ncbi:MAG: hypothetical protein AAF719_02205 [Pseudomonadota bacterium]